MPTATDTLQARAEQAAEAHRKAQAALAERAADQAADLADRQHEYDVDLLARYQAIGADLERQQTLATAEFDSAVRAGDLSAAFVAWVRERGYRPARQAVLDQARGAQVRTGAGQPIPDVPLRFAQMDFMERVMAQGDREGVAAGYDLGQSLLGIRPGSEG